MTSMLITGGDGFVTAPVLETLLYPGHPVVTAVRSSRKGQIILDAHGSHSRDCSRLCDCAVIHCATLYYFKSQQNKQDLLDPRSRTVGLPQETPEDALSATRVIVTSSSAAILDQNKPTRVFSVADWCHVAEQQVLIGLVNSYRASKTFVGKKRPNLSLVVCNTPLFLGPVVHQLDSLDSLDISTTEFVTSLTVLLKNPDQNAGNHLSVDVRDLAIRHRPAAEKLKATGKRSFMIIREGLPSPRNTLPTGEPFNP
ncbi:NAD(P)-binding protein [Xylaria sp. FL0043]|nr:NAD(P)-binding protein [Xylaria sp. FL0043]